MPDKPRCYPRAIRNRTHRRGLRAAFRHQIKRRRDHRIAPRLFAFAFIGAAVGSHAGVALLYVWIIEMRLCKSGAGRKPFSANAILLREFDPAVPQKWR